MMNKKVNKIHFNSNDKRKEIIISSYSSKVNFFVTPSMSPCGTHVVYTKKIFY